MWLLLLFTSRCLFTTSNTPHKQDRKRRTPKQPWIFIAIHFITKIHISLYYWLLYKRCRMNKLYHLCIWSLIVKNRESFTFPVIKHPVLWSSLCYLTIRQNLSFFFEKFKLESNRKNNMQQSSESTTDPFYENFLCNLFQIYSSNTSESSSNSRHAGISLLCHVNLQVQ